jgi:hypothetical protein
MSIHRHSDEAHADTDGLGSPEPTVDTFSEKPKINEDAVDAKGAPEIQYKIEGESDAAPIYTDEEGKLEGEGAVETNEDLVTRVIHVEDDPSLNPWTFRVFFLGTYNRDTSLSELREDMEIDCTS